MRRLWVFALLYLATTIFAQAAITKQEFDSEKNALFQGNVHLVINQNFEPKIQTELYDSAESVWRSIQNNPDQTKTAARIAIASTWVDTVQRLIDADTFPPSINTDLERIKTNLIGARDQAVITSQVEQNQITGSQATTARNAVATTQQTGINQTFSKPEDCSLLNGNILPCIDQATAWIIKNTILQLAGFLVWLTASMLNFAVQTGILEFSQWAPNSLYPLWIIIRQIVSLAVVFAGLWLGFMYIIGREDTFGKYIGWVVVFALFVNFSYPITRALIDVSNVISLNVYTSSVGSELLTGNSTSSAGSIMLNKIGLQGLLASAVAPETATSGSFVKSINSTPGALLAVVFALYAAYIFFVATAIIAARTAVLVFLTVASPLLLIDAVVPKIGDVAMKMREMYFRQLVVAPIFMIMFALTMKFLDIFQTPLFKSGQGDAVTTFFGILMMLIMLHIMLKVTRSVAGSVGETATNWMGKVGGFGLAAATAGTGILARNSVGLAAARFRDSSMLDKMQGTKTGRALFSLSNSLAQSSFDTRNIGMVNKGLATAGITGGLGLSMQQGSKMNYDQAFTERDNAMKKKYSSIRDAEAREGYLNQKTNSLGSVAQRTGLTALKAVGVKPREDRLSDAEKTAANIRKGEEKSIKTYDQIKDEDKKREYFDNLPQNLKDQIMSRPQAPTLQTGPVEGVAQPPSQTVNDNTSVGSTSQQNGKATIDAEHPGGSNTTRYESPEYAIPAVQRKQEAQDSFVGPQLPANGIRTGSEQREMTEKEKVNMMNSYRAKFSQAKSGNNGEQEGDTSAAPAAPKPQTPPNTNSNSGRTEPERPTSTV